MRVAPSVTKLIDYAGFCGVPAADAAPEVPELSAAEVSALRAGGEEFLLCFPDTNSDFAEKICGDIRTAVENTEWSEISDELGTRLYITISFGIAQAGADMRRTSILSSADTRRDMAKQQGRNHVVT